MIPPYEIVSLLQLGISDSTIFRNIISNNVIVDKKFSTFFTVEGLIEMIVFLSDKIIRVSKIIYLTFILGFYVVFLKLLILFSLFYTKYIK